MNKIAFSIIKKITPILLFNVIFFITWGINNLASVWISYAMIHIAYSAYVFSSLFNKESKQNRFFSFTNVTISLVYCIVQFIAGLTFIILSLDTVDICLYVQLPLLGIYIALIIGNIVANQKTESDTVTQIEEINFIRQCSLKLSLIMANFSDELVLKQLTMAKELIETSPSKSYIEVKEIEAEMLKILSEIELADIADVNNFIEKFIIILRKRNATVKTLH